MKAVAPTQKPHLLVVTSTLPRAINDSNPPFVLELSRRLARDFEVLIVAPRTPGAATQERLEGIQVIRYGYFFRRWETLANSQGGILARLRAHPFNIMLLPLLLGGMLWAVVRCLRQQPIAVVHAHWIVPQGSISVLARALARSPAAIVCTSHGGDLYSLRGPAPSAIKRWTLQRCAAITVVSNAMRKVMKAELGIPSSKIEILPMGVDTRALFTPDLQQSRLSADLLYVGRLMPIKGVDVLLRALALVRQQRTDVSLKVVGDGPEAERLQALSQQLKLTSAVTFCGSLRPSELPPYYQRATVLVAPSVQTSRGLQEGLGLVTAEAMACGCPVIASDVPAAHDLVEHEVSGLLFPAGEPAELAATIVRLLEDATLRQNLATAALSTVRARFDWDNIAERYAKLLLNAMPHPPPPPA